MVTRWDVTKAVRNSDLPAPSRLIMLTLADSAETGTAEIPPKFTPSVVVLARETGLDRRTVQRHLTGLEAAGWVIRTRPDGKGQWYGERVRYRLDLPSGMEPPQAAEIPQGSGTEPQGWRQDAAGVAAESPKGGGTEPPLKTDHSDQSQIKSDHPTPLASEVADAEIVDETPNLPAIVEIPNAGQLTRLWVDHCTRNGVKLPQSTIKRYARSISEAMKQGFTADLIKRALGQMLDDGEASRPSYFDNYLVRVQTGPAKRPRTLTPGEATVAKFARDPAVAAGIADMLANYGPKAGTA